MYNIKVGLDVFSVESFSMLVRRVDAYVVEYDCLLFN